MGQVRHGCATTTHAVRTAIQQSQASLAQLGREHGIKPKAVAKWRKRATVEAMKTGPPQPRCTVLTEAQKAIVVAFRHQTLLPLDDCLYAVQPSVPHLSRSALHRCLQWHGISRLPDVDGDKPKRQRFKRSAIRQPAGDACIAERRLLSHPLPGSGWPANDERVHCRGAYAKRQALPFRRNRPDSQVRRRPTRCND